MERLKTESLSMPAEVEKYIADARGTRKQSMPVLSLPPQPRVGDARVRCAA